MRSFRPLRYLPSLLTVVALVALSCAALAIADEIKGDANSITPGIETIMTTSPGQSGSGEFALVVSDNATDPVNGCNAGPGTGPGSKPPVVLTLSSNKPWLTLTQSTISLTGCDSGNLSDLSPAGQVDYSVAAAAPGGEVATVTASYQSGGAAGGSYTSGTFQVRTPVPTDTTAPVITPSVVGTLGDNGWYTSNVNVSFDVTDPESTVSSKSAGCSGDTVSSDTTGVTFTCTATSAGGSKTESVTIKRDASAPTIGLRPAGDSCSVPGENGWCRGEQTAGFTASDGTSGLVAGTSPHSFTKSTTTNGAAVNISSGTLKDNAGNSAAAIDAGPYKIDSVEPSIGLRPGGDSCSLPGDNGWCRGQQTAGFTASDGTSGFAGGALTHSFEKSTTTNGSAVLIPSGAVKDNAGNEAASIDAGPYKIDSANPTITGSASPAPNADGWNNGDVEVTFSCADDGGSGVVSCGPDQTLGDEGRGQSRTGNVTDEAGNSASDTVAGIHIDRTGPTAPSAQFDKASAYTDGAGVAWYKDSVAVSFGGSSDPDLDDDRVGIANKTGSGVKAYAGDDSLTGSGTLSYSGKATDRADNDSAATTGTVKVDADAPSLQTSGCPTAPVLLGSARSLSVSASDGESGLATDPSGTQALDTSSVGPKSVTVTARDNVGHEVSATCAYSVIFDFTGFLPPIDNPVTGKMNGVKAGSSVPVKFKLGGYQGLGVLAAGYPKSAEFPCGSAPVDVVPDAELASIFSASGNGLSYDMLSEEYSYVWKTDKAWAGKCRQLVVKFVDGQSRFVNFKAMK